MAETSSTVWAADPRMDVLFGQYRLPELLKGTTLKAWNLTFRQKSVMMWIESIAMVVNG